MLRIISTRNFSRSVGVHCNAQIKPTKRSQLFCPSQRLTKVKTNQPKSVDLLDKGGYIHQTASGIYSFLPLGLNVLERLISIIDRHMKDIHGQKVQMPTLIPASLWKATNRWNTMGDELIRVHDRNGQPYCLGPTHEESITDLVSNVSLSNKSYPLKLYQITPKYRDELRPRSALFRCKEFIMKDMYSFDISQDNAMETYKEVYDKYLDVFNEIQLPVVPVLASSGSIGGSHTHEFQVINEAGEDNVVTCSCGKLACNVEVANRIPSCTRDVSIQYIIEQASSGKKLSSYKTAASIKEWLNQFKKEEGGDVEFEHYITKSNINDETITYQDLFIFKHHSRNINSVEIGKVLPEGVQLLPPTLARQQNLPISEPSRYIFDWSVHDSVNIPDSAESGTDISSINIWGNFSEVIEGDKCCEVDCKEENGILKFQKGIEVGQTFYLGDKYSKAMNATYHDYDNNPSPLQMVCLKV